MSDTRTPRERYHDGHAAIVRLELAGEPVPEAWTARLAQLDRDLRALQPPPPIPGISIGNHKAGDRGVYVGRAVGDTKASPFGNPFRIKTEVPVAVTLRQYAEWLDARLADTDSPQYRMWLELCTAAILRPLTLVCWCCRLGADELRSATEWTCHAEVLRDRILGHLGQPPEAVPPPGAGMAQAALFDAPQKQWRV